MELVEFVIDQGCISGRIPNFLRLHLSCGQPARFTGQPTSNEHPVKELA